MQDTIIIESSINIQVTYKVSISLTHLTNTVIVPVLHGKCNVTLCNHYFIFRVLGQVSCEVVEPRSNRPTEGQLFINVELSPMASAAFEAGRSVGQRDKN